MRKNDKLENEADLLPFHIIEAASELWQSTWC